MPMRDLLDTLKQRVALCLPAVLFMVAALPAHATAFISNAHYISVEDRSGTGSYTGKTFTSATSYFAAALSPIQATPEPLSMALAGTGLIGIYCLRRRKPGSGKGGSH